MALKFSNHEILKGPKIHLVWDFYSPEIVQSGNLKSQELYNEIFFQIWLFVGP